MITQYKENGEDTAIIDDITNTIRHSLNLWYGKGSSLEAEANPAEPPGSTA